MKINFPDGPVLAKLPNDAHIDATPAALVPYLVQHLRRTIHITRKGLNLRGGDRKESLLLLEVTDYGIVGHPSVPANAPATLWEQRAKKIIRIPWREVAELQVWDLSPPHPNAMKLAMQISFAPGAEHVPLTIPSLRYRLTVTPEVRITHGTMRRGIKHRGSNGRVTRDYIVRSTGPGGITVQIADPEERKRKPAGLIFTWDQPVELFIY